MTGSKLEQNGWRQCSIFTDQDTEHISQLAGFTTEQPYVLIVTSQSCDIANDNLALEPFVEVLPARLITKPDGNLIHNKNARVLHTEFIERQQGVALSAKKHIEIRAFEKLFIDKQALTPLRPDPDREFEDYQARSFTQWLAARYSRPALPTAFNKRISNADGKGKLRARAKTANSSLSGLYFDIHPFAELKDDENYRVNLLGTIPADFEGDLAQAKLALNQHAEVMRSAGMDVNSQLLREDQVSIAMISRFRRFYYDDLSYRAEAPLPAETKL